jgi:molybdopterin-guanine dinucleotide biosynthesis protein A
MRAGGITHESSSRRPPGGWTGVVLAGGAGRRLGGRKALATLAGGPLLLRPVAVLATVCDRVAVVCKPDTELPPLPPGVERWDEPPEPRHPLSGIVHGLERAGGPVLVCAADMPFVTPEACRALLAAAGPAPATVGTCAGVPHGTFAAYGPAALARLRDASPDAPLARTVEALGPVHVDLPARVLRSVNTPEDLRAAQVELAATGAAGNPVTQGGDVRDCARGAVATRRGGT